MPDYPIFKYPMHIKKYHLDSFDHVNNAAYLQILEEARWDLLHKHGVNLKTIQTSGIGPVLLECTIKFLKELRMNQAIVVESKMLSFRAKVGIMAQNILNEQNELCSSAQITFGVFDLKNRKLIVPPQEWLWLMGIDEEHK